MSSVSGSKQAGLDKILWRSAQLGPLGDSDQRGAIDLITPAKRVEADHGS